MADIYQTEKRMEYWRKKINEDADILPENKKTISDFFGYCVASGLSKCRIVFYANRLYWIAKWSGKPFKKATKKDIRKLLQKIEDHEFELGGERKKYSEETKNMIKITLKKLYNWLKCLEKISEVKVKRTNNSKLPEQLLTPEEVQAMMNAAENFRDRAFISALYESGCRIGEMCSLKIENLAFDEYGVVIIVSGKTGQRRVRLVASVNQLTDWLSIHPNKDNSKSPLWITLAPKGKEAPMKYQDIRKQLMSIARKAGIKKRVNPHAFRHSRATHLVNAGLNESQLSNYLGWVQGTNMTKTYVHLSGRDMDDAILKIYGLKKPEENGINHLLCPRCRKQNPLMNKFCHDCGAPMNIKSAVEIEDKKQQFEEKIEKLMALIEKDGEIREFIKGKIQMHGL